MGADEPFWSAAGSGTITGSGTANTVAKFTGASAIGDSIIFDTGTNVGIGQVSPGTYGRLELVQSVDSAAGGISVSNIAGSRIARLWVDVSNYTHLDSGTGTGGLTLNTGGGPTTFGGTVQCGVINGFKDHLGNAGLVTTTTAILAVNGHHIVFVFTDGILTGYTDVSG